MYIYIRTYILMHTSIHSTTYYTSLCDMRSAQHSTYVRTNGSAAAAACLAKQYIYTHIYLLYNKTMDAYKHTYKRPVYTLCTKCDCTSQKSTAYKVYTYPFGSEEYIRVLPMDNSQCFPSAYATLFLPLASGSFNRLPVTIAEAKMNSFFRIGF